MTPSLQKKGAQGYADSQKSSAKKFTIEKNNAPNVPPRALSPISSNPMNHRSPTDAKLPIASQYVNREEPTFRVGPNTPDPSTMPVSNSRFNGATPIASNISYTPPATLRPTSPPSRSDYIPMSTTVRNISAEFGGSRTHSFPIAEDNTADINREAWTSAVGKANTGKSGQFIERITKENDMLKRDVKIFKLQADEAKNELKMANMKIQQQMGEWEIKLINAKTNETLLARRDRQLKELQEQVAREKNRATLAVESEKTWREQVEQAQHEALVKVEESRMQAVMQENRANLLADHWDVRKAECHATVVKVKEVVTEIDGKRQKDIDRLNALQAVCEQEHAEVIKQQEINKAINAKFEEYKIEKERGLQEITRRGQEQERNYEEKMKEVNELMGQLRWALNVKKNVRDAGTT